MHSNNNVRATKDAGSSALSQPSLDTQKCTVEEKNNKFQMREWSEAATAEEKHYVQWNEIMLQK